MEFQRRTKKLSGLPIAFYVVALLFFVLLFSFNSLYYKASEQTKPVIVETPKPIEEPKADSIVKPEIYVPDVEVLPPDTVALAKETPAVKEEKKDTPKTEKEDKKLAKKDDSSTPLRVIDSDSKDDKITKIGKDRILTGFISGNDGKSWKTSCAQLQNQR